MIEKGQLRTTNPAVTVRCILALLPFFLVACTAVPFDYPKAPSTTMPADPSTPLGELAWRWQQEHSEESGFIGLANGIDALGTRLRMAELAERSIDAQYFIIKPDRAGALFAGKLLLAADRGVRVRLLIDDIFTPNADSDLVLLDTHPNIEVRLFNPVSRRGFKYLNYLADFSRANRRMHNKSFTADGSLTIIGGRNIGEEYFDLETDVKFDDFEVLALGPVVAEVGEGFDAFWNSELALPVAAFVEPDDSANLSTWRDNMRAEVARSETGIYARAIDSPLLRDIRDGERQPAPAPATLITDLPDKLQASRKEASHRRLATEIGSRMLAAEREIIIVTPYFIPLEQGAKNIEQLLARGVRVVIVTNSLASTNHVPVHGAYSRYRKRLLRAGAEIYELRPDATDGVNDWGQTQERVTLHSKASVIDRDTIVVGSINFDPRSIQLNTEMALFAESPPLAQRFAEVVLESLPASTYKLSLDDDRDLRWRYRHDGQEETFSSEPLTGIARRFMARLYSWLPIESQL